MLRVKAFPITDDKGINDLLFKSRLASGANILISDGNVLVPYEDGAAPNKDQIRVALLEEKLGQEKQSSLMVHSQMVLELQGKGIEAEIERLEKSIIAPNNKEAYDSRQKAQKEIARLQNVLDQTNNQVIQNQAELTRIQTNITVYDKRIAGLDEVAAKSAE